MRARGMRRRFRGVAYAGAAALVVVGALAATPFAATSWLVRLALDAVLSAWSPSLTRATLDPSGELVVHDLILHEPLAEDSAPLLVAPEVVVEFRWLELAAARIRSIRAAGVRVHLGPGTRVASVRPRSTADSRVPGARASSALAAGGASTPCIDELRVDGTLRQEPVADLLAKAVDAPLSVRMTTSGDRRAPSRTLEVALGATIPEAARFAEESSPGGAGLRIDAAIHPVAGGSRVEVRRLAAREAVLAVSSDVLRWAAPWLGPELRARIDRIDGSLQGLEAAGVVELRAAGDPRHFSGQIAVRGLRLGVTSDAGSDVALGDVAFAAHGEMAFPPGPGTRIYLQSFQVRHATMKGPAADFLAALPWLSSGVLGSIEADAEALGLSGVVEWSGEPELAFRGELRAQDLSAVLPEGAGPELRLEHLTASAMVTSPLGRWEPGAVSVRDGRIRWIALRRGANALEAFDSSWHTAGPVLVGERIALQAFGGALAGSLEWNRVTRLRPRCELRISSIDMHRVLANVSPEHLDAEGRASGAVTVAAGDRDDLSGRVELAFDGPGILRIGEIQQVREMLAARLGPDLAERVLADLRHYPFRTATFQLESQGTDSQLELHVTRQTRTTADRRPPRDEVIGGKAVSVGSVVAPSIDLTVPITGKSLAEILSLVVGLSPQFHTVGSQSAP